MDDAALNDLLRRTYRVSLKSGARYVCVQRPLSSGHRLAAGDVIARFEVVKERRNGAEVIEEIVRQAYTYQPGPEGATKLVAYSLEEGQEVAPGDVEVAELLIEATFRNYIEGPLKQAVKTATDLHAAPDIPEKKLANAIATYANGVDPGRVTFLCDDTIFGSAKEGFLVTDSAIYYNTTVQTFSFRFKDLASHSLETESVKNGDKLVEKPVLRISLSTGETITLSDDCPCLTPGGFSGLLDVIVAVRESGKTKDVDGYVIVEEMPVAVKRAYLNTLVWTAFCDDGAIEDRELSELQVLMTQLQCIPEIRHDVRSSIGSPSTLDPEHLVQTMLAATPTGSETALSASLMKDAVRLHRATSKEPALERPGLKRLAALLAITDDQIGFVEEACKQDEKILAGEISDEQITAMAKDLASRASAVGVPIAAVYLSGSVTGLSAAGVTSGLASLGLGGLLGFSSMVTGIGVVIILGVGVYKGMQWLMGSTARDKASRRELMLQEVLRIHQKAIANLAEDIAFFAQKLSAAIVDQELGKAQIEKLQRELTIFTSALSQLRQRETSFESDLQEETERRAA